MKRISIFFLGLLVVPFCFSQANPVFRIDSIRWLKEARFGMFVHFGVSSQLEGVWRGEPIQGYSEWIMRTKKIPKKTYFEEVVKKFNPEKFNAEAWVKIAQQAGMKYFIVTAKHHDGVAMYDSKVSVYNIAASPFKRDLLGELKAACVRQGLKFGFYYSHAMDWAESNAPGNDWDWDAPGGEKIYLVVRNGIKNMQVLSRISTSILPIKFFHK
jgi:alpha-L-fucosidase